MTQQVECGAYGLMAIVAMCVAAYQGTTYPRSPLANSVCILLGVMHVVYAMCQPCPTIVQWGENRYTYAMLMIVADALIALSVGIAIIVLSVTTNPNAMAAVFPLILFCSGECLAIAGQCEKDETLQRHIAQSIAMQRLTDDLEDDDALQHGPGETFSWDARNRESTDNPFECKRATFESTDNPFECKRATFESTDNPFECART